MSLGLSFRAVLELGKARLLRFMCLSSIVLCWLVTLISHEPARDVSSSLPARGSFRDAELAGDDVLDGVVDIGEVIKCCEGNLLVLAEGDKI
jgi:hypothetical protein